MKKVLYLFLIMFFGINFSYANQPQMPTDEEILETIRQFHFDKPKEEYLLKETKKSLIKIYNDCPSEPDVQKTQRNIEAKPPSVDNPNKDINEIESARQISE